MKKLSFRSYLQKQLKNIKKESPITDFIGDALRDKTFREFKTWEEMRCYLSFNKACSEAIIQGRILFNEWAILTNNHDGLNKRDIERIKAGLRQAWSWSKSRKLVIERCTDEKGFPKCEKCYKRCPKIFVDHINPVGTFDSQYIERLFVPSTKMRGLCHVCHKSKTKTDIAAIRANKTDWGF